MRGTYRRLTSMLRTKAGVSVVFTMGRDTGRAQHQWWPAEQTRTSALFSRKSPQRAADSTGRWANSRSPAEVAQRRRERQLALSPSPQGYIVEYRQRERWDSGIPYSAVMVHSYMGGHSYLDRGTSGEVDIAKGGRFQPLASGLPFAQTLEVDVLDIDEGASTATIRISSSPGMPVHIPHDLPGRIVGQIPVDGSGGVIINGRFVAVPPRNPMHQVLASIAELPTDEDATHTYSRNLLKRQILTKIGSQITEMIDEIDGFGVGTGPVSLGKHARGDVNGVVVVSKKKKR